MPQKFPDLDARIAARAFERETIYLHRGLLRRSGTPDAAGDDVLNFLVRVGTARAPERVHRVTRWSGWAALPWRWT